MRTFVTLLLWATGCEPVAPDLSATTAFEQPGPAWAHKEPLEWAEAAPPPLPEDGICGDILKALPQVEARMRTEEAPAGVLDALERCFHTTGRGPELVGLYRRMYDAAPKDASRIARLAGALVTLGDASEALRVLASAPPDHPPSLFLRGLVLASEAPKSDVAKRGARDAWRRLLEVDPDHRGLDTVTPAQIQRRVARWSEELGDRPTVPSSGAASAATKAAARIPTVVPHGGQQPTSQPAAAASLLPQPTARVSAPPPPEAEATSPAAEYAKAMFQASRARALGRSEEARSAYTKALELRPDDPQALEGLRALPEAD